MPVSYNARNVSRLRRRGFRVVEPTVHQEESLEMYRRQFGSGVRFELVKRAQGDGGVEYQTQIIIKGEKGQI